MFEEIIAGVEMDLSIRRYATFEELRVYCYRVACAVGLVSIEIFGYHNPGCKQYAIELGLALQMTNIIRDVGKDLEDGRIYLPLEDLTRRSRINLQIVPFITLHQRLLDGLVAGGFFLVRDNPADPKKGLGWRDDAASGQVIIAYTYYGDANVDGRVDTSDFTSLALAFGIASGAKWPATSTAPEPSP